jgi:uncharacterized membrane protein
VDNVLELLGARNVRRRLRKSIVLSLALTTVTGSMLLTAGMAAAAEPRNSVIPAVGRGTARPMAFQESRQSPMGLRKPLRTMHPEALRAARLKAAESSQSSPSLAAPRSVSAATSPAGLFDGLNQPGLSAADEGGGGTPPDSTGAIGPTRYVEFVNQLIGVYDRNSLALLSRAGMATFVGTPSGITPSDPQIQWDAQANRWFYGAVGFASHNNYLLFGWSKTSDPTDLAGGWCRYGYFTGNSLQDYPKLGHDATFLIVGTNIYDDASPSFPFVTANLYAIPKPAASDSTCSSPVTVTYFADATHLLTNADGSPAFTPIPANTTDNSSNGYVVAAHDVSLSAQSKIMTWHLEARPSPVLVADGDLTVPAFAMPPSVPQPGVSYLIDSLDGRLTQAVARWDPSANAQAVWTQHTVASVPTSRRAIVRWYEFLPGLKTVYQQGQLDSSTDFLFNAAISPSSSGNDAAIFYNRGGPSILPVIGARSRQVTTPNGQMDPGELLLGSSSAPTQETAFQGNCTANPCRWGDYSGASPDPLNPGVIWGSNQLSGPVYFGLGQWTTQNFAVTTGSVVTPDFSVTVSPASQTVIQGSSTTYTVNINRTGGFTGAVNLSASGLPAGATPTFNPNPGTGSSSSLSVATSTNTAAGTYLFTVTGVSGSLTRSNTATLVVNPPPPPDFSLSASPTSQTVIQGSSTSYSVSINPIGGFSGAVTLSASNLPAGAAGTFNPNPAPGTSSALSVTTSASTPAGSFTFTITGVSGSLTRTTTATLVVNQPPDFSVSASPGSQTISQGSSTSYAVSITRTGGFSGSVTLSASNLPTGATGTFNPNPVSGTSSTLSVTTSASTPTGSISFTITGVSGSLTRSTTATLVVKTASTYSLAVLADNPAAYYQLAETTGSSFADSSASGYTGTWNGSFSVAQPGPLLAGADQSVRLSVSGGGYGTVPHQPSLDSTTAWTLEAWINSSNPASQQGILEKYSTALNEGNYAFRLSGGKLYLYVCANGNSCSAPVASASTIAAGTWYHVAATFDRASTTARIYINGVLDASSTTLTVLPTGSPDVTLKVGARGDDASFAFQGNVAEVAVYSRVLDASRVLAHYQAGVPADFSLGAAPSSQLVFQGKSTSYTVNITRSGGFSGTVTLSASNLPAGAAGTFNPNQVSGTSSTLSVTTSASTPTGSFSFTITGVSGSLTRTTMAALVVSAAPTGSDYSLAVLTDSPAAYYQLAETTGSSFADSSPSGYTGTWHGSFSLAQPGPLLRGADQSVRLSLSGGGYGTVPHQPGLDSTTEWTLEAWINSSNPASQQGILEKYSTALNEGNYAFRLSGGKLYLYVCASGSSCSAPVVSASTIAAGTWYHVAATFDRASTTARIYINGVLDAWSTTLSVLPTGSPDVTLKVGARGDDASFAFQGSLAEPAVYSRALDASRILAHYLATGPLPSQPSVSDNYAQTVLADHPGVYYRLSEPASTGPGIADASGNGFSGALAGSYTRGAAGALPSVSTTSTQFSTAAPGSGGVTSNAQIDSTTAWTLEAWVNTSQPYLQQGILEKYATSNDNTGNYALRIDGNAHFNLFVLSNCCSWTALVGATTVVANRWYHVVGTYARASTTAVLYVNGQVDASNTNVTTPPTGTARPLRIGARGDDSTYTWRGYLEEVAVYPVALAAARVQAHFGASGRTAALTRTTFKGVPIRSSSLLR